MKPSMITHRVRKLSQPKLARWHAFDGLSDREAQDLRLQMMASGIYSSAEISRSPNPWWTNNGLFGVGLK